MYYLSIVFCELERSVRVAELIKVIRTLQFAGLRFCYEDWMNVI